MTDRRDAIQDLVEDAMVDPFRIGPSAILAVLPFALISAHHFFPDTFGPGVLNAELFDAIAWVAGCVAGCALLLARLGFLDAGSFTRRRVSNAAISMSIVYVLNYLAWWIENPILVAALGTDWFDTVLGSVLDTGIDSAWTALALICTALAFRRDAIANPIDGARALLVNKRRAAVFLAHIVLLLVVDPIWSTWRFEPLLEPLPPLLYWGFVGATELLWYYLFFVSCAFMIRAFDEDRTVAGIAETFD
jgi:hypothetical protein